MNNGAITPGATVLTSWKDIARYMGKGVRTVQRWEQDFGLPVRRPRGANKKAVLARPSDLDAWVALRCSSRSSDLIVALPTVNDNPATDGRRQSFSVLCALNAEIQTSRALRKTNKVLLAEIHAALENLRGQISAISVQRARWREGAQLNCVQYSVPSKPGEFPAE